MRESFELAPNRPLTQSVKAHKTKPLAMKKLINKHHLNGHFFSNHRREKLITHEVGRVNSLKALWA